MSDAVQRPSPTSSLNGSRVSDASDGVPWNLLEDPSASSEFGSGADDSLPVQAWQPDALAQTGPQDISPGALVASADTVFSVAVDAALAERRAVAPDAKRAVNPPSAAASSPLPSPGVQRGAQPSPQPSSTPRPQPSPQLSSASPSSAPRFTRLSTWHRRLHGATPDEVRAALHVALRAGQLNAYPLDEAFGDGCDYGIQINARSEALFGVFRRTLTRPCTFEYLSKEGLDLEDLWALGRELLGPA